MARKERTTNKNNIVIVCEGTETEVRYLQDFAQYIRATFPARFTDIRIVPTAQELVEATERNRRARKLKKGHPQAYYIQHEDNPADFNTYRTQPTRYIREAELFLDSHKGGYSEAWAVYDFDNFPDHEFAAKHARQANVNIAYSSVSFEEWILAHFERNAKAFDHSVCKRKKKDIMCGTGEHPDDCHGSTCVGGRIREQHHIPDYGKTMVGLFRLLFDRHRLAMVNAAWLRGLHGTASFWQYNPYTTVDRLVARLMDYNEEYEWIPSTGVFDFDRTTLHFIGKAITNTGTNSVMFVYDVYDCRLKLLTHGNSGLLMPGESLRLQIPHDGNILILPNAKASMVACI